MNILGALFLLILSLASCYGWGGLVRRWTKDSSGAWPATIGVGLGFVIFIGGFLNLLSIAFAPALWTVYCLGLFLFIREMSTSHPLALFHSPELAQRGKADSVDLMLSGSLVLIIAVFTITTQVPSAAFGYHDDFNKYFSHPVRMLATGTLLGSPCSALGSATLGGQAYLQGFVLSLFPIACINAVDALFGLMLLILLAASAGWRRMTPLPGATLGVLAVFAINPQYINISTLYIGAALIATAVMMVADDRDAVACPSPFSLGLVFAALISAKPSFTLFVALYAPLSILAVLGQTGSWRTGLIWVCQVGLWTGLCLAPWLATHLPNYLRATPHTGDPVPGGFSIPPVNFLSTAPLFYGSTLAHYTGVVAISVIAGAWGAVSLRSRNACHRRLAGGIAASAITVALSYFILVAVMSPLLFGVQSNLRYEIPILLGAAIIPVLLAMSLPSPFQQWMVRSTLIVVLLAMMVSFVPALNARCQQAAKFRSILAFKGAQDPTYLAYCEYALADSTRQTLRNLQAKVPEGEPLLVWISIPFHLDYRRNPICDVEPVGLGTAWAFTPDNIQHVLWQPHGYAMHSPEIYEGWVEYPTGFPDQLIGSRTLKFYRHLEQSLRTAKLIAQEEGFILFQITKTGRPSYKAPVNP